jgi:hypothetical protein
MGMDSGFLDRSPVRRDDQAVHRADLYRNLFRLVAILEVPELLHRRDGIENEIYTISVPLQQSA